jgi:thioredoxin 1
MKKIFLIFLISVVGLYAYEELNINNFEEKIKDKNVIVDFYAPWCPPCKIVANNLEDFDITKPENVHIYKVNIDDELTLAKKYGVTKLPTLIYFKNGKPIKDYVGVLSSEELLQASKENFK